MSTATPQVDVKRVKLVNVILSYPFLHTAQPERDDDGNIKPGGKLTFSGVFIGTAKTPEDVMGKLKVACLAAASEKFGGEEKARAMIGEGALKWPLRKDVTQKKYDKVGGLWFLSARSQKKPGCVHRIPDPKEPTKPLRIEDKDTIEKLFYPGALVNATIRAYGYSNKSKGVTFSLDNVQWIADGERLDNKVDAVDDFAPDLNTAPADIDALL